MTRPVPLFTAPELLTLLEPHPLTDEAGIHGDYLTDHLNGDVYIIGRDSDRLARLEAFARDVDGVSSVTTRLNDTGISSQIKSHDLGIDDQTFDTICYTKETTSWFGRSRDFQRLTPHLKHGGTLLVKSKWLPDSNRLDLEEIAVAGAHQFDFPHVYLRYTKNRTQATLETFDTQAVANTTSAGGDGYAPRELAEQTRSFVTQFPEDARATEYSPGWSWHSELTAHAEEWTEDVTGRVANLCCGTNDLGDIRIDQLESWTDSDGEEQPTAATHIGDATDLPFDDNAFGGVITDPPWKVDSETRVQLFSEAVRVVEAGGRVLVNAWWIPHHPYATLTSIRPVIANVTEDSLGGPGGLSFLTEFEVQEQPNLGAASYTLAGHMETSGRSSLTAHREWPGETPATSPELDPRFVSDPNYSCRNCGHGTLTPVSTGTQTVYECPSCGFRSTPREMVAAEEACPV